MILLVNLCKEPLHALEFVEPVESIVRSCEEVVMKHYKIVERADIVAADKIIICGTSLDDFDYLQDEESFSWIKETTTPLLGICAGAQIIGRVFGGELITALEVGLEKITFNESLLGESGETEVYELHKKYVTCPPEFEVVAENGIPQAMKHMNKPIYLLLFHPEVRNKEMILRFVC